MPSDRLPDEAKEISDRLEQVGWRLKGPYDVEGESEAVYYLAKGSAIATAADIAPLSGRGGLDGVTLDEVKDWMEENFRG